MFLIKNLLIHQVFANTMPHKLKTVLIFIPFLVFVMAFKTNNTQTEYQKLYQNTFYTFDNAHTTIINTIKTTDINSASQRIVLQKNIADARHKLKAFDIWMRYFEPVAYKKINGPLPVEWETEVNEKFEKPYKRLGSGFTLGLLYLEETNINKDTLSLFFTQSQQALQVFNHDSITNRLTDYQHFAFVNRLYLLNLAAIYTTGFECSDTAAIIPELKQMLGFTKQIYNAYNLTFSTKKIPDEYLKLYDEMVKFTDAQPNQYTLFNHYLFTKKYVNPLFKINQTWINATKASTKSMIDYSLTKTSTSIFDKNLYRAQNPKGIFLRVSDPKDIELIKNTGKLLFYDPILSANNQRSCASCHNPNQFFTDTTVKAAPHFSKALSLNRNTPSLINVAANHLLMLDGKHISLQNQAKDVITNPNEMASDAKEVVEKVMNCKTYNKTFTQLLKHTPQETSVTFEHIVSAITLYYNSFSAYDSPFDEAMNNKTEASDAVIKGFNLFMSKAQCATCHFVPQFNGVKPPYTNSEFEVLGTPADKNYKKLSQDLGRYTQNAAAETKNAFRTGTLRNSAKTKPYMHNGVFDTLEEVIDFYNTGGGAAHGLSVDNQTLSSDSLHLTSLEITQIKTFIESLTENIAFDTLPKTLPKSAQKAINNRKIGGEY